MSRYTTQTTPDGVEIRRDGKFIAFGGEALARELNLVATERDLLASAVTKAGEEINNLTQDSARAIAALTAERDRLADENTHLRTDRDEIVALDAELRTALRSMREERDALREDKARLDWLLSGTDPLVRRMCLANALSLSWAKNNKHEARLALDASIEGARAADDAICASHPVSTDSSPELMKEKTPARRSLAVRAAEEGS